MKPSDSSIRPIESEPLFPPALNEGCFARSTPSAKEKTHPQPQADAHPGDHALRDSWGEDPERWDGMS